MTQERRTLPIAITMGDPAGIGPEIIVKAFLQAPDATQASFVVGDLGCMRRAVLSICAGGPTLPIATIETPGQFHSVPPRCLPLLQIPHTGELPPVGRVSAAAGKIAGDCVVWAANAALRGDVAAIVTAPLHKEALALAGGVYAGFPGHTEMLQAQAAAFQGKKVSMLPVRMMFANGELRTVLVSIHVSLRDAIAAVTFDSVLQTIRITHASLNAIMGRAPRIGVAGLNPHAGEGGLFGCEELDIIAPAIAAACDEGIDARGPFAPDTVFMRARNTSNCQGEFDVVVAMYHDQGLIPVKYLGVEMGVNFTLGLPLVRTSPDHGTAFDIAGKGLADASSMISAIQQARSLVCRNP